MNLEALCLMAFAAFSMILLLAMFANYVRARKRFFDAADRYFQVTGQRYPGDPRK